MPSRLDDAADFSMSMAGEGHPHLDMLTSIRNRQHPIHIETRNAVPGVFSAKRFRL